MAYFAAACACSLVNVTYRCKMASALSISSASSIYSSISAFCILTISFPLFPVGCLASRADIRWDNFWI
jgi:hypothetical protein